MSFSEKGCLVRSSHLIPGKKYSLEETLKILYLVSEHKNDLNEKKANDLANNNSEERVVDVDNAFQLQGIDQLGKLNLVIHNSEEMINVDNLFQFQDIDDQLGNLDLTDDESMQKIDVDNLFKLQDIDEFCNDALSLVENVKDIFTFTDDASLQNQSFLTKKDMHNCEGDDHDEDNEDEDGEDTHFERESVDND